MLRDYAVSLTLVALVLIGYTVLLFTRTPEPRPLPAVRTEASVKAVAQPTDEYTEETQPVEAAP